MRLLGVHIEENPFYASYDDECWITLAKEMMASYADKYAYQIPTAATSQAEYTRLEQQIHIPVRRSILKRVVCGPLGNIVDEQAVYRAFEERRIAYKESMDIKWKDIDS